jgi:hypothetical protein
VSVESAAPSGLLVLSGVVELSDTVIRLSLDDDVRGNSDESWEAAFADADAHSVLRTSCLDLDPAWPGPDGEPRGPRLCTSYPNCRCSGGEQ